MTGAEFERLFEPSVRVLFNFGRLKRERWPISDVAVTERDQLGALLLPWRHARRSLTTQARVGGDGVAHTVASAARTLHAMSEKRRQAVLEEATLAVKAHPRVDALPAARIDGGILLLDGVHRSVARYLAGAEIAVLLVVVAVPRGANLDWSVVDA